MSELSPGRYLLHIEGRGDPHCVSLEVQDTQVLLGDDNCLWALQTSAFYECLASAVDASCMTLFAVHNTDHDAYNGEKAALLELRAGAGCRHSPMKKAFPLAKRGKRRMYARPEKLDKKKFSALYKKTPYVRYGVKTTVKKKSMKWSMSLKRIDQLTDRQLVTELTKAGFLKDWTTTFCPHCGQHGVRGLQKRTQDGAWAYRCGKKNCQKFILPQHGHPVFSHGWGKNHKPFRQQVKLLLALTADVTHSQAHLLWEDDATYIGRFSQRLDRARGKYVKQQEKKIKFGNAGDGPWQDVEADEVDLRKEEVTSEDGTTKAQWHQWAGIVQRGNPASLVLFKTSTKKTKIRSPGPGPITKRDWTPMAEKWLKGRCVFLHTDGARSYLLGMNRKRTLDGVIHDYVVHKKKKVNGKWMKPNFVQLFRHRMPSGAIICTKGGTQIIDRIWRSLRDHLHGRNPTMNRISWDNRIRSAQWKYWNAGTDLWAKTGEMLQSQL